MLFKEPGSFKNNFKIGGNVDKLKAYRLIPLTTPLFFHFTLRSWVTTFSEKVRHHSATLSRRGYMSSYNLLPMMRYENTPEHLADSRQNN
jgi:hypothetical protein